MEGVVSVIIPLYNCDKYLKKCLESVLEQDYKNLEIILVDDGSTDASGEICEYYASKDKRIRVLHQSNQGQAVARNHALDVAMGDWVVFVDSDDYIKRNMISYMLECAQRNDASLVICSTLFDNGNDLYESGFRYLQETCFTKEEVLREYFTHGRIQTAPWGKLYKKKLFDKIRFPEWRAREDYAIMHELLGASDKTVHCGQALYIQRVRVGSTEYSSFNIHKLNVIECDLRIQYYIKENFSGLYPLVMMNYADALCNCMSDICKSFVKQTYINEYAELTRRLKIEIKRLQHENSSCNLQKHLFIVNHPIMFSLEEHIKGAIIALKMNVKKYTRR